MKIALNPLVHRYHVFRPLIVQPLVWIVFFLGPVLDLFRVDMIDQRMIFLGRAYPFETQYLMWIPIAFYALVVLIGVVSLVYGRLFCGWSCPHNIMTEWTTPLRAVFRKGTDYPLALKRLFRKAPLLEALWKLTAFPLGVGITFALIVLLSGYIVPVEWSLAQYQSLSPHIALVFGHGLFTLIGVFLLLTGHDFCRNACPYGMGQSMSAYQEGKWKPMEVAFTGQNIEEDCKTCTACQTVCPVAIDPRKPENMIVGQFYGCFNCGECIDACKQVHVKQDHRGILKFELPWERRAAVTVADKQANSQVTRLL